MPIAASTSATPANPANNIRDEAIAAQRLIHNLVHRSNVVHRQIGIGGSNHRRDAIGHRWTDRRAFERSSLR